MSNIEKKLDALIDALGYEINATTDHASYQADMILAHSVGAKYNGDIDDYIEYKVTKRDFKNKPTLHKIIRQYEKEGMSASEMIGRIMLMEGLTNEDL